MVPIKGNLINLSRLLIAAAASAVAVLVLTVPANAASPTTPVTLTIQGGTLDISLPSAGTALTATTTAAAATVSASLGLVTVTDARSISPATWNASVNSSDFTGTDVPAIPAADISYTVFTTADTANAANAAAGSVLTQTYGKIETISPAATSSTILSNSDQVLVSAKAGVGDNVVTWNPKITVTIPSTTVAGVLYTATITHSVL